MKKIWIRCLSLVLSLSVLLPFCSTQVSAASYTISLSTAQKLAISNSADITKLSNELILQNMKYVEAVDSIKAKMKNLQSFRWSPLISFQFPQQLDLAENYELNIQPLVLQSEITAMKHELEDLEYEAIAEAGTLYTDAYLLQEKIIFYQERLDLNEADLIRNQARLVSGLASQDDIDDLEKENGNLTTELSNLKQEFVTTTTDLSDAIGLDVTSSYTFLSPFKEMDLPREQLDAVTQYTLDNDQLYYETKLATSMALIDLNAYETYMRQEYGSKMNYIQTYIDMAKNGQDIDYSAFMLKYKEMITALDAPWDKSIRILFFTFTLEWFKGENDGSRYIEDEMYAVYTSCMAYANAVRDEATAKSTLTKQVEQSYNSLNIAWKSYENLQSQVDASLELLEKVTVLNQLGQATFEEYTDAQENYQTMQLEALDSLATYNELLFDFDRLTCGAVTLYMNDTSIDLTAVGGGDSFASIDPINDPYYYIYTAVEDVTFFVGVSIPSDFSPTITDFELWSGSTQIGERVAITQEISHLTIDYGDDPILILRFYDNGTFIQQCEVDASLPRDLLDLIPAEEEETPSVELGTYQINTSSVGTISTSLLTLSLKSTIEADSFSITYGTNNVYTSERTSVDDSFSYLTLLIASLEEVELSLYDDGTLVYTGQFDPDTQTMIGSLVE